MSENLNSPFQAIILDMDGVITDSAGLHARAWKQMFDKFLEKLLGKNYKPLDLENDYKQHIDGISRYDGVRAFLKSRKLDLPEGHLNDGPEVDSIAGLGNRKNAILLELIEKEGVSVFPDTLEMVKKWKKEGIKLAVISASRNCRRILEAADFLHWFDVRVDGETVRKQNIKGKPAPDVFIKAMEGLNAELAHTLIIEDAIAGVKAGKQGRFHLVIGVARNGEEDVLLDAGADIVVNKLTEIEDKMREINKLSNPEDLPHALGNIGTIIEKLEGKKPILFFDYDGTLTPIVDDPDDAKLAEESKETIEELSKQLTVAVVSGRGLDDLKAKVGIKSLIYAGSHGFEITGPGNLEMQYEKGREVLPQLDESEKVLKEKLEAINGCKVERKKYAIAVHYRNVAKEAVKEVKNTVFKEAERQDRLKLGKGKKILELKPDLDWHKGEALSWLLENLNLKTADYQHIFFGDDITDEDALKVVQKNGIGILVGTHGQQTYANYRLEDTDEVYQFLEELWRWYNANGEHSLSGQTHSRHPLVIYSRKLGRQCRVPFRTGWKCDQ